MHVVVLEDLGNFFSWSTADRNFVVVDQGEVCARDRLAAADHGPSNTSFSPGFCIFELLFIDRRLRSVVAHTYDFVPASGRRLKVFHSANHNVCRNRTCSATTFFPPNEALG